MGLIVLQLHMKAGWRDTPLAFWDLAEAIPIISHMRLPLLTGNNFQTSPPPHLLIFRLSVGPSPFFKIHQIIWKWRVYMIYLHIIKRYDVKLSEIFQAKPNQTLFFLLP